jgi:hypothetical protein
MNSAKQEARYGLADSGRVAGAHRDDAGQAQEGRTPSVVTGLERG